MGRHRSDPLEQRKLTLMRQMAGQSASYSLGGRKKEGKHARPKPSMPTIFTIEHLERTKKLLKDYDDGR